MSRSIYPREGASFDKIAVAQLVEPMSVQREKLEALVIQGAVTHLVDKLTHPMAPDEQIYFLLEELRAFFSLEGGLSPERGRLVLSIFTLKILEELGYAVHVDSCVVCHRPITDRSWFSVEAGGLIDDVCRQQQTEFRRAIPLSFSALKLIKYLQSRPFIDIRSITAPANLFMEVSYFAEAFLQLAPLKVAPQGFELVSALLR
jgi:DNA repair protein RecO